MSDIKYLTDEEVEDKLQSLQSELLKKTGAPVRIYKVTPMFEPDRCRRCYHVTVATQKFEIREAHNGQWWCRG